MAGGQKPPPHRKPQKPQYNKQFCRPCYFFSFPIFPHLFTPSELQTGGPHFAHQVRCCRSSWANGLGGDDQRLGNIAVLLAVKARNPNTVSGSRRQFVAVEFRFRPVPDGRKACARRVQFQRVLSNGSATRVQWRVPANAEAMRLNASLDARAGRSGWAVGRRRQGRLF